jgi:lipoprotein NlpD
VALSLVSAGWLLAGCVSPIEHEREAGTTPGRDPLAGRDALYHTIRRGETLSTIAARYGMSPTALARDNAIADIDVIRAGQRLRIRKTSGGAPLAKVDGPPPIFTDSSPVRGSGRFAWPVRGSVVRRYGTPVSGLPARGIVIQAAAGSAVRAADHGRVVVSCDHTRGYGKAVVLDHGNGWTTVYANNSALLVRAGDRVSQGQTIARAGSSGRAATARLEFRVYRNGEPQDPQRYLPPSR